jgi:pyruvate kinase
MPGLLQLPMPGQMQMMHPALMQMVPGAMTQQQEIQAATARAAAAIAAGATADSAETAAGLTPEQQAYAKILREKERQTQLLQEKIQHFVAQPSNAASKSKAPAAKPKIGKKKPGASGGGSFLGNLKKQVSKTDEAKAKAAGREVSGLDSNIQTTLHNPNQRVTSGRLG